MVDVLYDDPLIAGALLFEKWTTVGPNFHF